MSDKPDDEMPPLKVVHLAEHGTCSRCGSVCPTCATFVEAAAAEATGAWTPEKAQLFSSAHSLCLARDSMDPTLIAVAEWWRNRARRAFLPTPDPREVARA